MDIQEFIKKIEVEFDDLKPGILQPDSEFKEMLNWNSINSVVLSAMIEFEYHAMLTSDDFKKVSSIRDLADYIERKRSE